MTHPFSVDEVEPMPVRVANFEDMGHSVSTEEKEPEHFTCRTFVVQLSTTGQVTNVDVGVAQVLTLDTDRKDASIMAIDSPLVVCHTYRQAVNAANAVSLTPFPEGAYLPAGASLSVTGTGPLWVAATVNTASRVSVVQNRRGNA